MTLSKTQEMAVKVAMKKFGSVEAIKDAAEAGNAMAQNALTLINSQQPTSSAQEEMKKVTVRASGKCHRAIVHPTYGLMISCSCPGSRNGKLEAVATIIAEGWEKANCGN